MDVKVATVAAVASSCTLILRSDVIMAVTCNCTCRLDSRGCPAERVLELLSLLPLGSLTEVAL